MGNLFLDQGLVTARDPSLLKPGELSRAIDSYYKPGDPGLWCAESRTTYNATDASLAIKGVRWLDFDSMADKIVIHVGNAYLQGPAAFTGAFTPLVCGLAASGSFLDNVQYNDQQILFNGAERGWVIASGTAYPLRLGMLANTTTGSVANTGAGAGLTLVAGQAITYWKEERVKDASGNIIKRSAENGDKVTILSGPVTGYKPRYTRGAMTHTDTLPAGATLHWALMATSAVGVFPIGAEIAEAAAATLFIDDTRSGGGSGTAALGIPSGPLYELLTVTVSGLSQSVARNGQPPIFSTADVFEGSIVSNDISLQGFVRYTWVGEIHKWPATNLIRFSTKNGDEVRVVRKLGQHLVVLLRDSAWRVDYLPRPEDAAFRVDQCQSVVPGAPGVVGNLAAAAFTYGYDYWLAYVSPAGLMMTNGLNAVPLTGDLDWPALVNLATLSTCRLVNNDRLWRLELSYPSLGSSTADKMLMIHYHPTQLKGGLPKITGPINRPCRDLAAGLLNDATPVTMSVYGHKLYINWYGTGVDPATNLNINLDVRTGDNYLSGLSKQARVTRVWIHHNAENIGSSIIGHLISHNENEDDLDQSWSILPERREASNEIVDGLAEAFTVGVNVEAPAGPVRINYFALDGDASGDAKQ